jgi:hypothetical protein
MLFGLAAQAVSWKYGAGSSTRTSLEAASLAVTGAAAAALCLLRSRRTTAERLAWSALAAGVAAYAIGSIVIVTGPPILRGHAPAGVAALRSLLFVGLTVAVVVWTRERLRPIAVDQWVDGALAGIAVAAVGTLLLEPHVFPAGHNAVVISGAVLQPLVVLLVLGFVTATVGIRDWRPSRSHLWVLAALATLLVSSVIFAHDVSGGTYRPGSLVDAAWPLALALLGGGALVTPAHSVYRLSDLPRLVLPGLSRPRCWAFWFSPMRGASFRRRWQLLPWGS